LPQNSRRIVWTEARPIESSTGISAQVFGQRADVTDIRKIGGWLPVKANKASGDVPVLSETSPTAGKP
jgi:hypothetical protein